MPIYTIENTENGEIFDIMLKIADKEKVLQSNPHWRQVPTAPNLNFGGVGDRVKPDGGFKDVLSKIADANPTSKIADDYGKKDKKSVAIRDSMKRVRKKLGSITDGS
jgi:hypothetical protein